MQCSAQGRHPVHGNSVPTTVFLSVQCSVQLHTSTSGVPSRLLEEFDRRPAGKSWPGSCLLWESWVFASSVSLQEQGD